MADKEERILILTTHNEDGECECVTQDGCCANDKYAICSASIPKKKAIERMAKRLEYEGVNKFECHTIVEWCLDELLKGVKK